ncbi:hypothetical protein IAT38_003104 [Cryptococcus sp. DSM 104549]
MSFSALRTAVRRYATSSSPSAVKVKSASDNSSAHLLANIEVSWDKMSSDKKAQVVELVKEKAKGDWKLMTLNEKVASHFTHYGSHGYRAAVHKDKAHNVKAAWGLVGTVGAAFAFFTYVRSLAPEPIPTMNAEYQQETTDYMKEQNMNPISGVSSEGYKGKGMVQSPPKK